MSNNVLLRISNLKTYFPVKKGIIKRTYAHMKAVNDVSFDIYEGEVFGLVGESGCGKTTLGRSILQLNEINGGEIVYHFKEGNKNLRSLHKRYT
jgi:ABC-type oligopeptide transport system ATPase subunit